MRIHIPAGHALSESKVRELVQDFTAKLLEAATPKSLRSDYAVLHSLVVSGYDQDFSVGDVPVELRPLQKALVQFFLLHPEGVRLVDLMDACHVETLTRLYSGMARSGSMETQRQIIDRLVENIDGRLQQHMSRIRARFKAVAGVERFRQYTIEGRPGEVFSIALPRDRVQWTDSDGRTVDCRHQEKM